MEWDEFFDAYGLPGIQFTPDAISEMKDQQFTPAELAALIRSIRAILRETGQGLYTVLGIQVQRVTEEEIYLYLHV